MTFITMTLIAIFDSSLAHTAHWIAISFLSYGFKLSGLKLYSFFFSCFLSSCLPFRTFFFVFFCLLAKKFLSNISLYFPDVTAKGCLSFAFAFRCFRPYKNHPSILWVQPPQHNGSTAHRLFLKQTANRSFRLPPRDADFLLSVLLPKFPPLSVVVLSPLSWRTAGTPKRFLLGARGSLRRHIVTRGVSRKSTCSKPFWKYSHIWIGDMKS